jgi:hypothetical protein
LPRTLPHCCSPGIWPETSPSSSIASATSPGLLDELDRRGVEIATSFEIPPGPAVELSSPGPQRLALYELTRPDTLARLAGRRDF